MENELSGKGIPGFSRWIAVFLAAAFLAWSYVLYWQQLFHPGFTFAGALLYIFPWLALLHVGLSRLLRRITSLTQASSRQANAFTHLFFLPLAVLCFRHEFSRTITGLCLALYLLSNLVLIAVYRDPGEKRLRRGIFRDIACCLLLALLVFLSYYKFLRLEHYFLWGDTCYAEYPIQIFFGRSISQGIFPFWNPYNAMGLPVYAELQSQYLFPLYLLGAIFSPVYGFYHFILLSFVLPAVIGSIGFFALAKYLIRRRWIAFVVAVAYAFSGFAVYENHGTSRYMMAWLPYIVLFGVRAFISRRSAFRYCVAAAVAYALAIVSSYPILWYGTGLHIVLLAFLVWVVCRRRSSFWKIAGRLTLIILLSVLLAAPYLTAARDYLPYTNRAEAMSYDMVGNNALTPRSFITLWFPSTALLQNREEIRRGGGNENKFDMENFNGQDISYRSVYMTLPCLLFALIALVLWKRYRGLPILLAGVALFYLLMILGGFSFLYEWFYYFIPFFSRSRHPAMHRLFFIFYLLLLAAIGFRITFRPLRNRFLDRVLPWIVVLVLLTLFGYTAYLVSAVLPIFEDDLTLYSLLFRDGIFALLFMGGTLLFIIRRRTVKYRGTLIVGLSLLVIFDALNFTHARHLLSTKRQGSARYEESLKSFKKDFSATPNVRHRSLSRLDPNWAHDLRFTRGSHVVQPPAISSTIAWNSDQYAGYTDRLFKLYFRAEHLPLRDTLPRMRRAKGEIAYLRPGDKAPVWFATSNQPKSREKSQLRIIWYAPNLVRVRVATEDGALLEMVDTYFPGWRAFIGKNEAPIHRVNYSFKGVFVPPGNHEISFFFQPVKFLPSVLLSALVFCGAVLLCLAPRWKWWYFLFWLAGVALPVAAWVKPFDIGKVLSQNSDLSRRSL